MENKLQDTEAQQPNSAEAHDLKPALHATIQLLPLEPIKERIFRDEGNIYSTEGDKLTHEYISGSPTI